MISRVSNYSGRSIFVQVFFVLGFIFLLLRLFYIQIYQDDFIKGKVDSRIIHIDSIPAKRGQILDRNGRVLALDVTGYTLEIDLNLFDPAPDQIISLIDILDIKKSNIIGSTKKKNGFKILKRNIKDEELEQIKLLGLKGVYFRQSLIDSPSW